MKFSTKHTWHYPPNLRHVATLPWEIKNSNFLQMWKKTQTSSTLIASNFVIHPQISIFSVFKIVNLFPYWLQIKFSMSLLISCSKSCGTEAQLKGGQSAADRAVSAPKKMLNFLFRSSRSLPLTLFCRLSREATENTYFDRKENKVSGILRGLLKQKLSVLHASSAVRVCQLLCTAPLETFQTQVFTNNPGQRRDDRCIPVFCDISRTVLWVCGLSSWLGTKSFTVAMFSSVRAQIDHKSK